MTRLLMSSLTVARHTRPGVACWAPDAPEDIRLAAAIVQCARSLRQLLADYDDSITFDRSDNFTNIPF